MSKYLKILLSFTKFCWMGEMEFRANFLGWVVVNMLWATIQLVFINVVFSQVDSIAGWDLQQAMVLGAVYIIFSALLWIVILPNTTSFHQLTWKGDLDFLLLKPINSRFIVSTKIIEFDQLPKLVVMPIVLHLLLANAGVYPNFWQYILFGVLIILGQIIFYNIFFTIMTLNIWVTSIFNLENLFDSITEMSRFPTQVFKGISYMLFIFVIPIAFIATFPTQALLGTLHISYLFIAVLISIITFVLSQWFWEFSLRHYSSASS